ncbi:putative LRR containing protein [Trachipleistophora hominis]|uniref:Putative LRR containing protein n=1 Tax=Trachipleistophora hominis TaxID=72359 RepID=L7JSN3_TRAHO|nr:putative LRR containing protein [Trachipleistophora hominis]
MKCDRLKSFTLKNNSFIYYKSVYEKLTFLDLENVEINHSVVFNENMKSVRLVNVHVRMFNVLKINKPCETLYIRGCKGNIVIPQVASIGGS